MKKLLLAIAGAQLVAGAVLVPTVAMADPGNGNNGAPPGAAVSTANTPCASHGAFGAFTGNGNNFGVNNPGSNGRPGAANWRHPATSGATTGDNNSDLCGNAGDPPGHTP